MIEVESADGAPILFFAALDRTRYPARGRRGGQEGARGRVFLASGRPFLPKGAKRSPATIGSSWRPREVAATDRPGNAIVRRWWRTSGWDSSRGRRRRRIRGDEG